MRLFFLAKKSLELQQNSYEYLFTIFHKFTLDKFTALSKIPLIDSSIPKGHIKKTSENTKPLIRAPAIY